MAEYQDLTEHDEEMIRKFDSKEVTDESEDTTSGEEKQAEEQSEDRPDWLPSKFKTPEDLAKAYKDLQRRMSSPSEEKTQKEDNSGEDEGEGDKSDKDESEDQKTEGGEEEAREAAENAGLDFDDLSARFQENGQLEDADYEALEKSGIPRHMVDAYIEGQMALAERVVQETYDLVGGEEEYTKMATWAQENLPAEELEAFNRVVNTGQPNEVRLAIRGIHSQYRSATGSRPKLMKGRAASASGSEPFRSTKELTTAMSDERYKTDAGYRKQVQERLAKSNVL